MKLRDVYGKIIFEQDVKTLKELVEIAIRQDTNLRYADLQYADLQYADLQYADLRYASLYNADLRYASLYNANLQGTILQDTILQDTNLQGVDLSSFVIVPEGTLVVWKKANNCLLKLIIPKKAKRVNALGSRKCRFEYAFVKEIIDIDSGKQVKRAYSSFDTIFEYRVGKFIYPDKFDDDVRVECSHGIHAFITREEALNYQ